jgi:hypothetical protein
VLKSFGDCVIICTSIHYQAEDKPLPDNVDFLDFQVENKA